MLLLFCVISSHPRNLKPTGSHRRLEVVDRLYARRGLRRLHGHCVDIRQPPRDLRLGKPAGASVDWPKAQQDLVAKTTVFP